MEDFDPIPAAERNFCDAQDAIDDARESAYEATHSDFLHACTRRDLDAILGGFLTLEEVISGLCNIEGEGSTEFIRYFLDAACGNYPGFSVEKKLKHLADQYATQVASKVTV